MDNDARHHSVSNKVIVSIKVPNVVDVAGVGIRRLRDTKASIQI